MCMKFSGCRVRSMQWQNVFGSSQKVNQLVKRNFVTSLAPCSLHVKYDYETHTSIKRRIVTK